MKKRFLPLLLALVMCLGLAVVPAMADNSVVTYNYDKTYPATGGVLGFKMSADGSRLFAAGCEKGVTEAVIPSAVDGIPVTGFYYQAFAGCTNLKSVTIPNSIAEIDQSAFEGCKNLTNVIIPSSVTKIGLSAFNGCDSLTHIVLPDSVTEIDENAFWGCRGLTSIDFIPGGVTVLSHGVFASCTALTSVTIPNSITEIGTWAFLRCTALTSVTIPASVTKISREAFKDCKNLTAVTIPADVTEIGESAFGIEDPNDYHNTISNPKVTIYGVAGSYAETYAKENGIKFVAGAAPGTTVAPTEPQRPTAPAGGTAASSTQSVLLDGKDVTFYTYEIDGYNYVKLRDMAKVLSGTKAQFEVSWDEAANSIALTGGKSYTVVGGEMVRNAEGKQPYQPCDSALLINGQRANLEAYTINDNNFFKLRDLGRALGFNVSWINDRIVIASNEPYSDAQ